MTLTLLIEWPNHPDWAARRQDITLGEPFYLVGSEGKYTVFVQTAPMPEESHENTPD